jgi:membrane protein implicated in regulation of membrane protease activity
MIVTLILLIAPVLLLVAALFVWRWLQRRDDRRDPVNMKVLRGAGDGVREKLSQHADSFDSSLILALLIGPSFFVAWAQRWMTKHGFSWSTYSPGWFDLLLICIAMGTLIVCFRQLVKHASAARNYRQGLAAELATAQCLNQVMAEGGLVFHDFLGDGFNIDHIVVGQSAVFAIETKSRLKPAQGGKDSARLTYDGVRLAFPMHTETKPIEQARRQAEWLARFLASGVGEPVRVVPYLALPGWFVENKVPRPDVLVGNPRNPMFMVRDGFGPALGEAMKRRIAHVLSEKYPAKSG